MIHRPTKNLLGRKNLSLTSKLFRGLGISFLFVAVSVFALLYAPIRGVLTQSVYSVAPGVWHVGNAIENAIGMLLTNFKNKNVLVTENEMLNEAVAIMETKVLDRNLLAEKITKLEEALGRVRGDNRVVASVIAGPWHSPYDTLVIDVGEDYGVSTGDIVVYSGSGVIGEIIEVTNASSKIKLYSSPGEEHLVSIGAHFVPVKALGKGMGNFEAKIPQDIMVAVGDDVVSAKGDLLFGKISLVDEKPAEPFKRIFFRVQFNITEIRMVEVIIDKR
ncbi:MAG: rod shape-determining protein MreC [Minisyncoccia bacterium]